MSLDYFIKYPCKVREIVSNDDLLRMLKSRSRASAVLEYTRTSGQASDKPGIEQSVLVIVAGPEGPVERKVKIADLIAESEPLKALESHCVNCEANLRGTSFGCGGAIHYPVQESTERWLMERLPESLAEPAGQLLKMALKDFNITGKPIDDRRPRQDIYASDTPVTRSWGWLMFKTKINSSQILQMLMNVGHLQPSHSRMMALFLGFLDGSMQPANISKGMPSTEKGDSGIEEFTLFLRAIVFSGVNGHDLFVDA